MRAKTNTKSDATKAQLRQALEMLLCDVVRGNLSGRNPYGLDSVKGACKTLTGNSWGQFKSEDVKHEGQE